MATVRIGSAAPVDMRNAYTIYGTARIATSTQIEIVAGSYVWDYFGQGFTYSFNGAVVGGTLTGYSQTYNGGLVVTTIIGVRLKSDYAAYSGQQVLTR